jgi:Exostosin family
MMNNHSLLVCQHVRGTQVQSPRLIEILLFGCVPVIMADTYDLPLSDILDWSAFSVRVPQDEPQLLRDAIQKADYASLARNVCAVRRFFMFHAKPQPGDAFWMTMFELRRRLQAASSRPECVGSTAAAVQMNGTVA